MIVWAFKPRNDDAHDRDAKLLPAEVDRDRLRNSDGLKPRQQVLKFGRRGIEPTVRNVLHSPFRRVSFEEALRCSLLSGAARLAVFLQSEIIACAGNVSRADLCGLDQRFQERDVAGGMRGRPDPVVVRRIAAVGDQCEEGGNADIAGRLPGRNPKIRALQLFQHPAARRVLDARKVDAGRSTLFARELVPQCGCVALHDLADRVADGFGKRVARTKPIAAAIEASRYRVGSAA